MLLETIIETVEADLGDELGVWLSSVLIPRAVRLYSTVSGVEAETTIMTEAGEDEYDLPADCAMVVDVEWWPSGTDLLSGDTVAPAIVDTTTAQGYGYTRPSEFLVDNANRAAITRQLRGTWRQKNTVTLVLDPEPTAGGLAVPVTYLKMHALTGTGANRAYATIPDHHLDVIVLLTKAEYLEARGDRAALKDDFRQGATSVTRGHVPGNIRRQAARLRRRAFALMGQVGALGGAA
jgi:hypothetical protein